MDIKGFLGIEKLTYIADISDSVDLREIIVSQGFELADFLVF
jgi:hypothetical protein